MVAASLKSLLTPRRRLPGPRTWWSLFLLQVVHLFRGIRENEQKRWIEILKIMPDDPNLTGKADDSRINVGQEHEVSYWSRELGVTPERLREVIGRVGPMVADVKKALGK